MNALTTLFALTALSGTPMYAYSESHQDLQKIANYLMQSATFQGDGQFMTVKGTLPRSYFSDANYWGGYCDGNACDNATIKGVGFSDQDNHQILSGEWTFGAINAVHSLNLYYKNNQELQSDEASMKKSILRLRNDQYQKAQLPDSLDPAYQVALPKNQFAYLYANKRYHIPFGWYANPIPSTASTSWAVMVNYQFNPFVLGG